MSVTKSHHTELPQGTIYPPTNPAPPIDEKTERLPLHTRVRTLEDRLDQALTRLNRLELQLSNPARPPASCRHHTCPYFTAYLDRGPPHLTHRAYHETITFLTDLYAKASAYHDAHPDRPNPFAPIIDRYEADCRVT